MVAQSSRTAGPADAVVQFTGGDGKPARARAVALIDHAGNEISPGGGGSTALPAGVNRSGNATTTSGDLFVAANASRKSLVGQNNGTVKIAFNEFNGTATIDAPGSYTVAAGQSFSISTNQRVNFVAASGTPPVTLTET